jgi:hypothetical protein
MLPVAVHVPGIGAAAPWGTIPILEAGFPNESATAVLNPTTARRTPIEQRTKPISDRRQTTAQCKVPNDLLARLTISLRKGESDRFRPIFITSTSVVRAKAFARG